MADPSTQSTAVACSHARTESPSTAAAAASGDEASPDNSPRTPAYAIDATLQCSCSLTCNFNTWLEELDSDPDKEFILRGIAEGFDIISDPSDVPPADCKNYPSATGPDWKPKLDRLDLFQAELAAGYISESVSKPRCRIQAQFVGTVAYNGYVSSIREFCQ